MFSSLVTIFQSLDLHSKIIRYTNSKHKHQQDNSYPDPAAETQVSGTQHNHNTRTQRTTNTRRTNTRKQQETTTQNSRQSINRKNAFTECALTYLSLSRIHTKISTKNQNGLTDLSKRSAEGTNKIYLRWC